jgi:ribosomal protein S18 acetylase RimI-like enzyme
VFGAYHGGEIVGVVRLGRDGGAKERHKGSIHGFYVEPAWRQRGVGSALMRAAIDDARRDLEQLTLRVVDGNKAAIALYERFGFRVYGVEPRARKTDAGYADVVEMVLFLAEG